MLNGDKKCSSSGNSKKKNRRNQSKRDGNMNSWARGYIYPAWERPRVTYRATSACGRYRLECLDGGGFRFLESLDLDDGHKEWIITDVGDDDGIGYLHIFA